MVLLGDQRRRHGDDVAGGADQETVLVGLEEGGEGALGRLAGDRIEFDRADHTDVADVDHVRQVLQRMQAVLPVGRHVAGPVEEAFLLVGFQRCEAGGGGNRIARIGVAVEELDHVLRATHEGVVDLGADENGTHRDDPVGKALGRRHDIGRDAVVLRGERRSHAAETGDDLVEDQQDAVPSADIAELLKVALRRNEDAGGAGHRFDDDGGDGRSIMQGDDALQLGGEVATMFGLAAGEGILARLMGVRHVVDAGEQRAEHLTVGDDAADGDAAEVDAVIAALAAYQAEARTVALHAMIGEGDLESGVDRLGAGIGVEDVVQAFRCDVHQAIGKLEGLRMAELEGGSIIQFACLFANRLGDLRPAVAGIDAPEAGRRIENLAPVMRRIVHILCTDEEARLLLELAVCRERHPERAKIVRRGVEAVGHDMLPVRQRPAFLTTWSNYQGALRRQAWRLAHQRVVSREIEAQAALQNAFCVVMSALSSGGCELGLKRRAVDILERFEDLQHGR
ncbi:protein of unknown function [Pseudorhizobium banfieldiae]|uniref:Uncharacterized protein n=1 Tax=Pseudorhizobium banfieldiae TaxID=1125847 RepID=L0NGB0_9HYPH|nr:protein of unknown function [Pseudorhizobium banfieldiae]